MPARQNGAWSLRRDGAGPPDRPQRPFRQKETLDRDAECPHRQGHGPGLPEPVCADQSEEVADVGAWITGRGCFCEPGSLLVKPTISRTWTCSGRVAAEALDERPAAYEPAFLAVEGDIADLRGGPMARAAARSTATALALSSAPGVPGPHRNGHRSGPWPARGSPTMTLPRHPHRSQADRSPVPRSRP